MQNSVKIALLALLLCAFLIIVPSIFLWAVNSLAEAGGADFYIDHTTWNYFVSLILLILVQGSSAAK